MSLKMKVKFEDTPENWHLWGQLVERWIHHPDQKPKTVKDLITQGKDHKIANFAVPGAQDRKVEFYDYDEEELAFLLADRQDAEGGEGADQTRAISAADLL